MLGLERDRLVLARRRAHGLVPPPVAALIQRDLVLGAPDDEHVLDRCRPLLAIASSTVGFSGNTRPLR